MSTKVEKKLNYNLVVKDNNENEEDEYKDTIHSYRDEIGDDDYDYINGRHASYDDEYYD